MAHSGSQMRQSGFGSRSRRPSETASETTPARFNAFWKQFCWKQDRRKQDCAGRPCRHSLTSDPQQPGSSLPGAGQHSRKDNVLSTVWVPCSENMAAAACLLASSVGGQAVREHGKRPFRRCPLAFFVLRRRGAGRAGWRGPPARPADPCRFRWRPGSCATAAWRGPAHPGPNRSARG